MGSPLEPDPFPGQRSPSQPAGEAERPIDIDALAQQETVLMLAISELTEAEAASTRETVLMPKVVAKLPLPFQRLTGTVLGRLQDPDPDCWSRTLTQRALKSSASTLGWFPLLALLDAFGTAVAALGPILSRLTSSDQENIFWLGLALIFAPSFLRLLSPLASRRERMCILGGLSLCLYLAIVVLNPLHFIFADEYLHWRTVDNIVRTGHLFGENSLLTISPFYPGLEIVTDALSKLSGLDTFTAGLLVAGISHLLLVLSLFRFYELASGSTRIAGLATAIYMTNSEFFYFNSLFVYETLALALAVFLMVMLVYLERSKRGRGALFLGACLVLGALVITHHITDLFFVGLLIFWVLTRLFLRQTVVKAPPTGLALLGVLLSAGWMIFVASPVFGYLLSPINTAVTELEGVLLHSGAVRQLFVDRSGLSAPLWQRLVTVASLALTVLGLPFGLLSIWRKYRQQALVLTLGLLALLYPVSQLFRFVNDHAGIADRSAPFLYLAVGIVLAIFLAHLWPARVLRWRHALLFTLLGTLVFQGGIFLGIGPTSRLMPGSYVVEGEARSVTPESIQAALWTLEYLHADNRVVTDRDNTLLFGTYGDQDMVTPSDGVSLSPVFFTTDFFPWEQSLLQSAHVQYMVIDLRLSTARPDAGYYYEQGEPETNSPTPISRQALTKFDIVPGIDRLFDSGNIIIYSLGGLSG